MPERLSPDRRLALGLALVPFVALGLARFAFGLLVPAMRADLAWTYFEAGLVTTANAVGYLAGAALSAAAVRRFGIRVVLLGGVWGVGLSLLLNGLIDAFGLILVARFLAGLFAGFAFVAGGVLATQLSARGERWALVVYPVGAGAAIAATAVTIPGLLVEVQRWPMGWFLMAVITAACAVVLGVMLGPTEARSSGSVESSTPRIPGPELAYGLFGLGYIAYVTFAVAYLVDGGFNSSFVTLFWLVLGLASVVATLAWTRFDVQGRGRLALTASLGLCGLGALLLVLSRSAASALLSSLLYGGSFLAVVSSVTQVVRDEMPPESWPSALGRFTIIFGIGQILGPVLAGILGDSPTGLRLGLGLSAAALLAATAIATIAARHGETAG